MESGLFEHPHTNEVQKVRFSVSRRWDEARNRGPELSES
jgi:hypothetical protein